MNTGETLRNFAAEIRQAVESFSEPDSKAKQVLNQLASTDPPVFFAAAIRVAAASKPSEGLRYLIVTLAKDKRLSMGLLDSSVCSLDEAVAVTRAATAAGVQLQATFEIALNKALQGQASPHKAELIARILDILDVAGDASCWSSFQVELMAYPDKVIRAKAALLIGRSTRNVGWIARRLLDRDPRVQASAVEALWGLDPEEAKPHYLSALKSSNNRVVANAALGLYLTGDVTAVRILREMLQHDDASFRLSALWAMGETRDERFLPVLTEHYKQASGKQRLAAMGAMSRIRRRDINAHQAGEVQIHISQASEQSGGHRRLAFALSCHPARDLSGIRPTDLAIWEDGTLIEDYRVKFDGSPALLMVGYVAPWAASGDEPYEKALREAWKQCLCMKRHEDMWRIDRYSIDIHPADEKSLQECLAPYDDSIVTTELRASHGCMSDPDIIGRVLSLPVPRNRTAADPLAALQRQSDVFAKRGGKRHVFLFLHEMSGADLQQDDSLARLRTMAQENSVVFHGIAPDVAGQWPRLRDLCLANPEGSFAETTLEGMVDGLVDAYANLCNRFEITYAPSPESSPGAAGNNKIKLKISSTRGFGECDIALQRQPAPPPAPAAAAPATPAPAPEQVPQPVA
ncbi:MAG TPA: HEAT repeat domain-containing protein [Bryobacteraceae bacterium]|nr:HEAT repeat domain-containing protein [Bryobacteraceae bacterium]